MEYFDLRAKVGPGTSTPRQIAARSDRFTQDLYEGLRLPPLMDKASIPGFNGIAAGCLVNSVWLAFVRIGHYPAMLERVPQRRQWNRGPLAPD
jgi:hypothetical protein